MKRFLISPPFGNWMSHPDATRVMGSYTLERRRGLVWNTLKSLRPIPGGYVNRIGLRNPGIRNVRFLQGRIYSVVGLNAGDWEQMLELIPAGTNLELNLGCPNVHEYGIPEEVLKEYVRRFRTIAKLPATSMINDVAAMCVDSGVPYLHCSNTLPTPRGGESGCRLKAWNLPVIERLHARYQHTAIIAGGGIYGVRDVEDYAAAGAAHFSLATVWFRPWRARAIIATGG